MYHTFRDFNTRPPGVMPDKPAHSTLRRPRWLARLLRRVNRFRPGVWTRGEVWLITALTWLPVLMGLAARCGGGAGR